MSTYDFELHSQVPNIRDGGGLEVVADTARRAERYGFDGILVFYNHHAFDPWILSSVVLAQTARLVPLVALQPYAAPPFTAAKMVKTLTELYGRRIDLNLIAGAAKVELEQVGDTTPHDDRYTRAIEYAQTLRSLFASDERLDVDGQYYQFRGLQVFAQLEPSHRPRIFLAGSSPAGRDAAARVGDVTITHPEPVEAFETGFAKEMPSGLRFGIRIGVLARPHAAEAWKAARERYPVDRWAQLTTKLKLRSESQWSQRLAKLATGGDTYDEVYWTGAFGSAREFFPMLVGNYEQVREYLGRYLATGVSVVLLGGLDTAEDFDHVDVVMRGLRAERS